MNNMISAMLNKYDAARLVQSDVCESEDIFTIEDVQLNSLLRKRQIKDVFL